MAHFSLAIASFELWVHMLWSASWQEWSITHNRIILLDNNIFYITTSEVFAFLPFGDQSICLAPLCSNNRTNCKAHLLLALSKIFCDFLRNSDFVLDWSDFLVVVLLVNAFSFTLDLAEQIMNNGRRNGLALMRGFLFWLQVIY